MTQNDRRPPPPADRSAAVAEATLDSAFAALQARPTEPDAALMARVMADAEAGLQGATTAAPPTPGQSLPGSLPSATVRRARMAPRRGRPDGGGRGWRRLVARAPMPAGLAAALMVGVWIGFAVPVPMPLLEEALFGPWPLANLVEPGEVFAE